MRISNSDKNPSCLRALTGLGTGLGVTITPTAYITLAAYVLVVTITPTAYITLAAYVLVVCAHALGPGCLRSCPSPGRLHVCRPSARAHLDLGPGFKGQGFGQGLGQGSRSHVGCDTRIRVRGVGLMVSGVCLMG